MTDLSALLSESRAAIASAASIAAIEDVRVAYLGKKGKVTELLKTLGTLSPEEKKSFGAAVNALKNEVTEILDARKAVLNESAIAEKLQTEWVDVTLPARPEKQGRIHPVTQVTEEIVAIFSNMGFAVAEGPEIETDDYNFTALNFPQNHPAREMHDTFFLKPSPSGRGLGEGTELPHRNPLPHPTPLPEGEGAKILLRTHTSPVQIRTMQGGKPPFRFIAPGKTYRHDSDMTHTPMFHQVEGFVVDKGIHMGHLKGCIEKFVREFFEVDDAPVRFRPSFFPFTEPSAEVDIGCTRSRDSVIIGKGLHWLEMGGCGMIHPNVLKNCGIDPNEWQGFAFGWGIDRLAMLKYGMPDLRIFFEADSRWLQHYGFNAFDIPGDAA